MTTASIGAGRPLNVVYGPADTEPVSSALAAERDAWRGFLKAKAVLLGLVRTAREVTSAAWLRLASNQLFRYAARSCAWALSHGRAGLGQLPRPGIRPGLLWLATSSTGRTVLRHTSSLVAGLVTGVARRTAGCLSWLLRHLGARGRAADARIGSAVARARQVGSPVARDSWQLLGGFLRLDGLLTQALRAVLAARALGGLAKAVLPRPWNLLARALVNVALVPATIRRDARQFLSSLLTAPTSVSLDSEPDTDPDTDPDPEPRPAAMRVVPLDGQRELKTEQASSTEVVEQPISAVRDVEDLDEIVPSLQRYPAKKNAGNRRR